MKKLLTFATLCAHLLIFTACQNTLTPTMTYPDTASCLAIGYNSGSYTLTNFRIQCQRIEDAYYPFEGIVKDKASNTPIAGVKIEWQHERSNGNYTALKEVTSPENGEFSLDFTGSGKYRLLLSKAGYQTLVRDLDYTTKEGGYGSLLPDKPARVTLQMEKN